MDKELESLRKKIDVLDSALVKLISKRLKLARKTGKYKQRKGLKIIDKKREKEILLDVEKKARKYGIDEKFLQNIFKRIIKESRKNEK